MVGRLSASRRVARALVPDAWPCPGPRRVTLAGSAGPGRACAAARRRCCPRTDLTAARRRGSATRRTAASAAGPPSLVRWSSGGGWAPCGTPSAARLLSARAVPRVSTLLHGAPMEDHAHRAGVLDHVSRGAEAAGLRIDAEGHNGVAVLVGG